MSLAVIHKPARSSVPCVPRDSSLWTGCGNISKLCTMMWSKDVPNVPTVPDTSPERMVSANTFPPFIRERKLQILNCWLNRPRIRWWSLQRIKWEIKVWKYLRPRGYRPRVLQSRYPKDLPHLQRLQTWKAALPARRSRLLESMEERSRRRLPLK